LEAGIAKWDKPSQNLQEEKCDLHNDSLSLGMNMLGGVFIFLAAAALLAIIVFILEMQTKPSPSSISTWLEESMKHGFIPTLSVAKINEDEKLKLGTLLKEALNVLEKK